MKISLIFFILLLSGCSTAPYVVQPVPEQSPLRPHTVFVTMHGEYSGTEHTGIILPAKDMDEDLPFLTERFAKAEYYEVGWGEKDYYQARKKTADLEFKAMYWPTDTAIHIVAIRKPPAEHFPRAEIIEIQLSGNEYNSLRKFISDTFYRNHEGKVSLLQSGLYGDDQFYLANGEYTIFNTCNVWTAKALKSAGRNISPSSKLTANSVMASLRKEQRQMQNRYNN